MSTPAEMSIGTYETGYWFVCDEVLHRARPELGFTFKLNTIEEWQALHPQNGTGFFHSSLIVETADEADGKLICVKCFPQFEGLGMALNFNAPASGS